MPIDRYRVKLTRQAEKDLKSLRPWTNDVLSILSRLEDEPLGGHALKGSLRGSRSLEFNLKGSGAFRGIYWVYPDDQVCLVYLIASHENVYREAERRFLALTKSGDLPPPN